MILLKQSTAAVVPVGPFVDKDDGVTAETALASQDGRLVKNGTGEAFTPASWSHEWNGHYLVGLSAEDTDALGRLRLAFHDAAVYLPVWWEAVVVTPAAYEALCGAGSLADWSEAEREQVRQALGLSGAQGETTGDGHLDLVLSRVTALQGRPVVTVAAVTGTEQDVTYFRGDTAPIAFDLGRDITGASLAFTVKRRAADPQSAALIVKTSADPAAIEITDAAAGQFRVHLAPEDTAALLPDGRRAAFLYDVEMTLGEVVETVAAGDFVLLPDVTTE